MLGLETNTSVLIEMLSPMKSIFLVLSCLLLLGCYNEPPKELKLNQPIPYIDTIYNDIKFSSEYITPDGMSKYVSSSSDTLLDWYDPNHKTIAIAFKKDTAFLKQELVGSGYRFANGIYELRGKGEEFVLFKHNSIVFEYNR